MLPQHLISLTLRPLDLPPEADTSDGRMSSWKRGEVGVDSRFSEQSIPGGLYVTIGTLGRLACRKVDGRVRELVDQVQMAVAHAVVTCLASAGTTNPGSVGDRPV
jgi:hypothetical protein